MFSVVVRVCVCLCMLMCVCVCVFASPLHIMACVVFSVPFPSQGPRTVVQGPGFLEYLLNRDNISSGPIGTRKHDLVAALVASSALFVSQETRDQAVLSALHAKRLVEYALQGAFFVKYVSQVEGPQLRSA